jgi:hypothetical protein
MIIILAFVLLYLDLCIVMPWWAVCKFIGWAFGVNPRDQRLTGFLSWLTMGIVKISLVLFAIGIVQAMVITLLNPH